MGIFQRFRRTSQPAPEPVDEALPADKLPQINDRVTIARPGSRPVASRVEDQTDETILLAQPTERFVEGEEVVVHWERDHEYISFRTRIASVNRDGNIPMIGVTRSGSLAPVVDEPRETHSANDMALQLRVVRARDLRRGTILATRTSHLGMDRVRFMTTAPLTTDDVLEARMSISDSEHISARIRIVRVETARASWRRTCEAVFDEMLRSDRARIATMLADAGSSASTPETDRSTPA